METENQGQSVGEQALFPYYDNLYHLRSNKELSLEEVYNLVKGNALRHVTGEIRRAIAEGNPVKAKSLKMQLPCIAVSCRFPEERRTEEAGDYLGYVLVDTDGLTCPAAEYRDRCAAIPFVAFAQVSASGNGNHLVARVKCTAEELRGRLPLAPAFLRNRLRTPHRPHLYRHHPRHAPLPRPGSVCEFASNRIHS